MKIKHQGANHPNLKKRLMFDSPTDLLHIGRIYAQGRKIPADPCMAYQMFSLAIAMGCRTAAVARQHISAEMNISELRHARAKARSLIEAMS